MNVLLLNQFFYPDGSATAQIATQLAIDLVANGLKVTALASRGSYLGGDRLPGRATHEGVDIVRVPCTSLGKGSVARRISDYATFYAAAAYHLATIDPPDAVIAMSTPPLVAALGASLKLRGVRFVYWVQDLYPDLAFAFNVLSRGAVPARCLDLLARSVVKSADAVVVLGEAMRRRVLDKGADAARTHVIPNWADGREIWPVPRDQNAFRQRLSCSDDKPVYVYSGNMGAGHDVETLVAAARGMPDSLFLFIGDGVKKALVDAAARECSWIRIAPYQKREQLAQSLSVADVHLIAQDARTVGLLEPSKLYGVLAAGRPVVYVGPADSEVARTIEREQVGVAVANGDVRGTIAALRAVTDNARAAGQRARRAFDARYERRIRTGQFASLLESLNGEPHVRWRNAVFRQPQADIAAKAAPDLRPIK